MADLNTAASAAGLTPAQKKQIEKLSKALEAHKTLLNLPAPVAEEAYQNKFTASEKQDMQNKFGTESPEQKPPRGWLGTAWHYVRIARGDRYCIGKKSTWWKSKY